MWQRQHVDEACRRNADLQEKLACYRSTLSISLFKHVSERTCLNNCSIEKCCNVLLLKKSQKCTNTPRIHENCTGVNEEKSTVQSENCNYRAAQRLTFQVLPYYFWSPFNMPMQLKIHAINNIERTVNDPEKLPSTPRTAPVPSYYSTFLVLGF